MTSRQQQALETKERILKAAQQLIAEKGIEKATIKDIAEASDVAVGTFYLYFKSKGDIVLCIDREPYEELLSSVRALNIPLRQKLCRYFTRWHKIGESYGPGLIREWYRLAMDPQRYENITGKQSKVGLEISHIDTLLKDGIASGELDAETPVGEVARLLACELWGNSMYWCIMNGKPSRKKMTSELFAYIIDPLLDKYGLNNPAVP